MRKIKSTKVKSLKGSTIALYKDVKVLGSKDLMETKTETVKDFNKLPFEEIRRDVADAVIKSVLDHTNAEDAPSLDFHMSELMDRDMILPPMTDIRKLAKHILFTKTKH